MLVRKIKNKRLRLKNDSEMKIKMIVLDVNKMELKADQTQYAFKAVYD